VNRLRFRLARLFVALAAVTLVWACNAPPIPVPPPGATFTSALVSDGQGGMKTVWTTHGDANEHAALARFFVINLATNAGVITTAASDGTYAAPPIDGQLNDRIEIFYETPMGDKSQSACLLLHEGPSEIPCP
jgi:hypothetical protein